MENIIPFGLAPVDVGYRNQIIGAINALNNLTGNNFNLDDLLILPDNEKIYTEIKNTLYYSKFKNYMSFKKALFERIDYFMQNKTFVPRVFITAYNATESNDAGKDADKLCFAIKQYYKEHNLGKVMTIVLTSRYYKYKYADLINIPKHLMTLMIRIRLLKDLSLKNKVLVTTGTVHNLNIKTIKTKHEELKKKLTKLKKQTDLESVVAKFEDYKGKSKKVVILLGGRVQGPEIDFNLDYVKKIFANAQKLTKIGYGVVIVNGSRTPNNITDYLYKRAQKHKDIIFHNCKRIAQSSDDRDSTKWRIYSGKYEEDFHKLQQIGNIYPGIIGYPNTLVVHTKDSYSCCETACSSIPTSISSNGLYIDNKKRYDCQNLVDLMCPLYAIDFDEFVKRAQTEHLEPKDLKQHILSNPLRVFAETIVNRYLTLFAK